MAREQDRVDSLSDLEHKNAQIFELIRRFNTDDSETAANLADLTAWSQIGQQAIGNARQYADQGQPHHSKAWQQVAGFCMSQGVQVSKVIAGAIDNGVQLVTQWDYDPNEVKP